MHHVGGRTRGQRSGRERAGSDAGFSVVEMLIVCVVAGIAMSFAMMGIGKAKQSFRARAAVAKVTEQLTVAREMAVSQQRYVMVEFLEGNRIVLSRIENPSGEKTTVRDVILEGGMTFVRFAELNPTPDNWGGDEAVAFGAAKDNLRFRSDGALVDEKNDYVNGRVFLGADSDKTTAGFISVFGATGRVRSYRVEGNQWVY